MLNREASLCFWTVYLRAVPLKNPRGGDPPPLKIDPPAPRFSKIFDPPPQPPDLQSRSDPPAPRFAKSFGPPRPQIQFFFMDPPAPRFFQLFGPPPPGFKKYFNPPPQISLCGFQTLPLRFYVMLM